MAVTVQKKNLKRSDMPVGQKKRKRCPTTPPAAVAAGTVEVVRVMNLGRNRLDGRDLPAGEGGSDRLERAGG